MDDIAELADRVVASPSDPDAKRAFLEQLTRCKDAVALRQLAENFSPHTEVSIPLYERALELAPEDVATISALGFLEFLDGEDDAAHAQLERARLIDGNAVPVLTLEAALARTTDEKVSLYRRILEMDPTNRIARAQLARLQKS